MLAMTGGKGGGDCFTLLGFAMTRVVLANRKLNATTRIVKTTSLPVAPVIASLRSRRGNLILIFTIMTAKPSIHGVSQFTNPSGFNSCP